MGFFAELPKEKSQNKFNAFEFSVWISSQTTDSELFSELQIGLFIKSIFV